MTTSYTEAKIEVERLINQFASLSAQNRKHYNEAATRQGFILPLFRALDWNTENTREVSPEEKVSRGFVDFAFRIGGIPRFFLETKKIPADLDDPRWARQAINYAWLKGVTWAVLSDFEELKVFNAEWQETIPVRAIFKDLHWQEYLDRFDDLWLLSRPAMEEGALDQAAEDVGKKAKKTPISRLLFADLTEWRRDLFRTLRPYNPMWSVEQIDEAVQCILDRLIFIRTCEDRGIEEGRLLPMLRQWRDQGRKKDLVRELKALFREFDAVYDSRLFSPHLCEELSSEATPFERIVEGLYEVPGGYGQYDFNAIDADVLGTIYEQYLGHRAQDPEGKQVVDKRARRKAQGIYYTPQFVVRYIVAQTLGRYLEEHDYAQARQVRVLDMACGSGSFLIEAFDVLDRYLAGVRGQDPASPAGDTHDFARRMEILTGNLYGVDLDAQAVEIARLNLLLKAVNQRGHLPMLDNVRQGNSLISGTPEELEAAFGPDWQEKHPFNWEQEFLQIMARGGFDVIVGNPPYKLLQPENTPQSELDFIHARYRSAQYKVDVFHLFIERAVSLLQDGGLLGFIVPNTFLMNIYTVNLRQYLLDHCSIDQIVVIPKQVFPDAEVDNAIIIVRREADAKSRQDSIVKVVTVKELDFLTGEEAKGEVYHVAQNSFIQSEQRLFNVSLSTELQPLLERVEEGSVKLGQIARIHFGMQTRNRKKFPDDVIERSDPRNVPSLYKPCITGKDMNRYFLRFNNRYVYFSEEARKGGCWDPEMHLAREKLVVRQIGEVPIVAYDDHPYCCLNTVFMIRLNGYNPKYVMGLLNSKLISKYWRAKFSDLKALFPKIKGTHLKLVPIHTVDFDDPADAARHDRMVALVEEMLRVQEEHAQAEAHKEDRRHDLARQIERLDTQIDALVYALYGLTEEEIAIVEES